MPLVPRDRQDCSLLPFAFPFQGVLWMKEPTADWLTSLRRKYGHPGELRAQMRTARTGLNTAEEALLRCCPPPNQDALVLGCGAGREVLPLAARGWRATGADLVDTVLAACRQALAQRKLAAELVPLAEPLPLPFATGSFSAALLLAQLLEHLPARADRLALLRETARVLQPRGIAYLSTHEVQPADRHEIAVLAPDPRHPADIMAAEISSGRSPGGLHLHLYSREEILADLAAAGLSARTWLVQEEPGATHPVWRRFLYLAAAKKTEV